MIKFLFVYHGGSDPVPAEELESVKKAWGDWFAGKDGGLAPLLKQLIEAALRGKLEAHLSPLLITRERP